MRVLQWPLPVVKEALLSLQRHCKLQITHFELYNDHCKLYIVYCKLQMVNFVLYIDHCKLHIVHCKLRKVNYAFYNAHCKLQKVNLFSVQLHNELRKMNFETQMDRVKHET